MHVGAGLQDLLPLVLGPDHESIHGSLDMRVAVPLPLGLADDLGAVTLGVLLLLLGRLQAGAGPELGGLASREARGRGRGEGGEGRGLVVLRADRPRPREPALDEVQVRQLREGRPRQARQKPGVSAVAVAAVLQLRGAEAEGRHLVEEVARRLLRGERRGGDEVRQLGLVEHLGEGLGGAAAARLVVVRLPRGLEEVLGLGQVERTVIVQLLALGRGRGGGGPTGAGRLLTKHV